MQQKTKKVKDSNQIDQKSRSEWFYFSGSLDSFTSKETEPMRDENLRNIKNSCFPSFQAYRCLL